MTELCIGHIRNLPEQLLCFFSLAIFCLLCLSGIPQTHNHRLLLIFFQTDLACPDGIRLVSNRHKKSALVAEPCTGKPCSLLQFFIFKPQPLLWKTAFVIHGIRFLLWLDTISATIRRKNNKRDICLLQPFLTRNKFRQHQNTRITTLCLLHGKYLIDFLVRARVCTITCKLVFEDHPCHLHGPQKSDGQTAISFFLCHSIGRFRFIPHRIKIANQ